MVNWRILAIGLTALSGCERPLASSSPNADRVVVYAALDKEFSQPILDDFAKNSGIEPLAKFDIESTKTIGLVSEIIAERKHPRCDLFWNNEILNTLRLEKLGLLDVYRSPAGEAFPARWRSPDATWHAFAARARVLLVNKALAGADRPNSIMDMADPRWRGKIGLAKPLFGTTATHAACLFAALGDEKAKDFFRRLKANDAQILGGNRRVAEAVSAGQLAFGLTDTDDAIAEVEQGMPVEIVYPDQQSDGLGTLFIPNTLCVIKGGPHPAAARRLVDYLLSAAVERRLAESPSAQIPLNPQVRTKLRVETPNTIKAMDVDFRAAADQWEAAAKFLRNEFTTGD